MKGTFIFSAHETLFPIEHKLDHKTRLIKCNTLHVYYPCAGSFSQCNRQDNKYNRNCNHHKGLQIEKECLKSLCRWQFYILKNLKFRKCLIERIDDELSAITGYKIDT